MASISKDKDGTKRIVFIDANGKRHYVRLGRIDMKMAGMVKVHIENLVVAQITSTSPDTPTAQWVASLPEDFHAKLAKTGLMVARRRVGTLEELVPAFIMSRAATVSEQTIEVWRQSEISLYRFFGGDRRVDTITHKDAESFRSWLVSDGMLRKQGGLKPTTVWKRLQHVVAFFKWMVKNKDITESPFDGMTMCPSPDTDRNDYVDADLIRQVMAVAPDAEWRLIIALWRFAGLRGSSEPLLLRWQDISFDKNTITVHAKKTQRYGGVKAVRTMPLFPELIEPILAARAEAHESDVYVITKHAPRYLKKVADRSKLGRISANLGTIFAKFVRRAGVEAWSKIINNVRASWITDLLDGKYQTPDWQFGIQVIAEWAGNSPKVILRYYGRIRPQVFMQVTQFNEQIKSGTPVESFFRRNTLESLENTMSNTIFKVAQNPAQYTAAEGGIVGNDDHDALEGEEPKSLKIRYLAARSGSVRNLTESFYFTKTEKTGFAGYLAKY